MRGDGPIPVILVPGLSCDASVFDTFAERNKAVYTMYCVTLAGNGGTTPLPMPEERDYAKTPWLNAAEEGLVTLVAERKLDHPVPMGHSLGGFLSQRTAADHPGMFRAAITIDGYPAFPTQGTATPAQRAKVANDTIGPLIVASTTRPNFAIQQGMGIMNLVTSRERAKELTTLCAKTPPAATAEYMLEIVAADISEKVKVCETPILAVIAVTLETAEFQKHMRDVLDANYGGAKNVTIVQVMKSRHFVQDDAPGALDKAVSDFLQHRPPTTRVSANP